MNVWVVYYHTESGDEGVAAVYNREPTTEDLNHVYRTVLSKEMVDEDGDGEMVSYAHLRVYPCRVETPTPDPVPVRTI